MAHSTFLRKEKKMKIFSKSLLSVFLFLEIFLVLLFDDKLGAIKNFFMDEPLQDGQFINFFFADKIFFFFKNLNCHKLKLLQISILTHFCLHTFVFFVLRRKQDKQL